MTAPFSTTNPPTDETAEEPPPGEDTPAPAAHPRPATMRKDWLDTPSTLQCWDEIVRLAQARQARHS